MLNLLKPKYLIPVNGEYRMRKAHSRIAEEVGMKRSDIFLIDKGDVVEFRGQNVKIGEKFRKGQYLHSQWSWRWYYREALCYAIDLLSQDGILIVVVRSTQTKKQLISGPEIITGICVCRSLKN
ncbi:hypothetical protein ACEQPO_13635 [Bacillus sp. SL00103]